MEKDQIMTYSYWKRNSIEAFTNDINAFINMWVERNDMDKVTYPFEQTQEEWEENFRLYLKGELGD